MEERVDRLVSSRWTEWKRGLWLGHRGCYGPEPGSLGSAGALRRECGHIRFVLMIYGGEVP